MSQFADRNRRMGPHEELTPPAVPVYTRAAAFADGSLVDVSDLAKEAGFHFPVALTASVYAEYVRVPDGVLGQDETGRLWDILTMLGYAIRSSQTDGDTLGFQLYVRNDNRKPRLVTLKSVCGPDDDGSPCLTVMLPVADTSPGTGQSFDERQARRFHPGELQETPGATLALAENGVSPAEFLARHVRGDWGEVTDADRDANEAAIGKELRIWSVYRLPVTGETVWVITEADRSATTVMLPDEY